MKYTVFSDGAARGNPGSAGAGFVVYDVSGKEVGSRAIALGNTTNNVAEYTALIEAVKFVETLKPESVDFFLDSELVVNQIAGRYKVKTEHLKPLYAKLVGLLAGMNATVRHVRREANKVADALANKGADKNENS